LFNEKLTLTLVQKRGTQVTVSSQNWWKFQKLNNKGERFGGLLGGEMEHEPLQKKKNKKGKSKRLRK